MDYKQSGVNIDEGNRAIDFIKSSVKSTHSKSVLSNFGGFAAGFELPLNQYKKPVLVSATDGVGTKLMLAIEVNKLNTIGIDCVAMCVNDLICLGATPLFFLDYIACDKVDADKIKTIIDGVVKGCRDASCSLVGGETAEMNDMYKKDDFDIAGFCVGIVEKDNVIDGKRIKPGDFVYALESSGIHSNGYSLVRNIINNTEILEKIGMDAFLEPTKIYVNDIAHLKETYDIKGIANITGGGIAENLERVLGKDIHVKIDKASIRTPVIFDYLQRYGNVSTHEMFRVFNMGVGMIVISADDIHFDGCYKVGSVIEGNKGISIE